MTFGILLKLNERKQKKYVIYRNIMTNSKKGALEKRSADKK